MKYASKTSYFAFFLALKRLILQIFGRQNVLFCIFLNLKTSYFADFWMPKRLILHFFEPQNVLFCIIHQVEEGGCAECHPASYFILLPSYLSLLFRFFISVKVCTTF